MDVTNVHNRWGGGVGGLGNMSKKKVLNLVERGGVALEAPGEREHPDGERQVYGRRRCVGPPPEHPSHSIRQPAARLNNVRVRGSVEPYRPLPVPLEPPRRRAAHDVVGGPPWPTGKTHGLVVLGAFVVGAHDGGE